MFTTREAQGPRRTKSRVGCKRAMAASFVCYWLDTETLEPRRLLSSVSSFPIGQPPVSSDQGTTIYVASGSDGNVWFTEQENDKIGRMTPGGQVTEYPLPSADAEPQQIIAGPDGALWFVESGVDQIGRITTSGQIIETAMPSSDGSPQTLAAGPDGNVWFIDSGTNEVGKITPGGQVTEFPVSSDGSVSLSSGITAGSDGNLWFTAYDGDGNGEIGGITPAGVVKSFPLSSDPLDLTSGPDGNLWVDGSGEIDRVTPQGAVTAFALPNEDSPFGITTGPDGALWYGVYGQADNFGRITTSGSIEEFNLPNASSDGYLNDIVWGPENRLWYATDSTPQINDFDPASALLAGGESLTVTAGSSTNGTLATFTDLGGGTDPSDYQASIDWGDGATSQGAVSSAGNGQFSVSASHPWGIGYFNTTVTITDVRPAPDPLSLSGRTAVAYGNVQANAPTPVGTGIAANTTAGKSVNGVVADFSNVVLASLSTYSATIAWGDGHVTTGTLAPDGNGGIEVSGSTRYAASGSFTVTTQLYDYPEPPIFFDPGPWEPLLPVVPVANGGATTAGTTAATTPTVYSAGSPGSSTATPTAHLPARYMPVKHTGTASPTGAGTSGKPVSHVTARSALSRASASSGAMSGGSGNALVATPIDFLPIWGQIPGIGSATSTATVAAGQMNGTGYTVLAAIGMPFDDVIASFALTDSTEDLSHLHASVQWADPGVPQFGNSSAGSTPQPATITANGAGGFTVSATNTFSAPGVSHFIVLISDDRLGSGDPAVVGAAYGEAFVPWPREWTQPLGSTLPVAWAGGVVNGQGAASTATGVPTGGGSSTADSTYPALYEQPTAKAVRIRVKAGRHFSGKLAAITGIVTPKGKKLTGFAGTIDWGDGSAPTAAAFVRGGNGAILIRGRHTFQTAGAATITLNLTQALTTTARQSPAPPIHLPTVEDAAQIAPGHK